MDWLHQLHKCDGFLKLILNFLHFEICLRSIDMEFYVSLAMTIQSYYLRLFIVLKQRLLIRKVSSQNGINKMRIFQSHELSIIFDGK